MFLDECLLFRLDFSLNAPLDKSHMISGNPVSLTEYHGLLLERSRTQEAMMSVVSNADYIASIEQSISVIGTKLDSSVVKSVFERYGAHDIEDLNPSDLPEVFSELYAIEADLG